MCRFFSLYFALNVFFLDIAFKYGMILIFLAIGDPCNYFSSYAIMDAMSDEGKLRIELLQAKPCLALEKNMEKGLSLCEKASSAGADIALFPEMWSNGYRIHESPFSEWRDDAIAIEDPFIEAFQKASAQLSLAIGLTFLKKGKRGLENSFVLFDRHGKMALTYSKVHTCDFDVERYLIPGDDFHVCHLDTAKGDVVTGAMICYDREFPESARILMLKGAELILVPNACPMEINRLSQLRARSFENMVAVATCNYPSSVYDSNGHSTVFDGIAYLPSGSSPRDMCILEAGEEEGIFYADIDLDLLRSYRSSEVHGNAYRHPEKYRALIDESVSEPFIRKDSRRE